MKRSKVFIADDHSMVIDGLRGLLEPEFEVVGAVNDGRAVLPEVRKLQPDVVVIDISMPLLNGLDCTRQLRDAGCTAKILILTMHPDATLAQEALAAGASGYLLKSSPGSELKGALRDVLQGRTYLSPGVTRDAVGTMGRMTSIHEDVWAHLTPRQREVLQLLAEGKSHKEVAHILNISVKTAEYHKYAILDKLGLKTNAELVQYAVRHGIIAV
ncbi:MAG TPA: response regulator transcription factor [Terracidiphilus sp.]|jgi:DNA-binding NarL/FixJ family response regulator|nr:response regulator transcription factor [Terracidiphilus sp.]